MLYATGLVAGGSLAGIAIALLIGFGGNLAKILDVGKEYYDRIGPWGDVIGFVCFAGLAFVLLLQARAKSESA
jgi:hypothetical protein